LVFVALRLTSSRLLASQDAQRRRVWRAGDQGEAAFEPAAKQVAAARFPNWVAREITEVDILLNVYKNPSTGRIPMGRIRK
jgi:hypothetical protein